MWFFVLVSLITGEWKLPGSALPKEAADLGSGLLVVRQHHGDLPEPWYVTEGKSHALKLPPGCLYLCPDHREENQIRLVFSDHIQLYKVENEQLVSVGKKVPLAPPISTMHPWLWLPVSNEGAVIFEDGFAYRLSPALDSVRGVPVPSLPAQPNSWLNPVSGFAGGSVFWSEKNQAFRLMKASVDTVQPPDLQDMENAVCLSWLDQPVWLIHGGKRGDLDSFGWRLVAATNELSGEGVVTRFGVDPFKPFDRFLVFTTSSSLRTQAFHALRGFVELTCNVLLRENHRWRVASSFKLRRVKTDDDQADLLDWQTDLNGDGWADLILADKKGLRCFLSTTKGELSSRDADLADNLQQVMQLPNALVLGRQRGDDWYLTRRSAP